MKSYASQQRLGFHSVLHSTMTFTVLTLLAALCLPSGAQKNVASVAVSGDQIIREMCKVYQSAETFQDRAEAKITNLSGPQYIQSNDIRFKKPNLIVIESRDPIQGTFYTYATGSLITVYSGKQNIFMQRECPPDLSGTLKRIGTTVKDTIGVNIEQMLSPISFLSAKNGQLVEGSNFKIVKKETLDGHEVYRLSAKARDSWFQKFIPANSPVKIVPDLRDIVLWVDVKSHLLVKAFATLTFHIILPKSAGSPQRKILDGITFVETHSNTRINPSFQASDFSFRQPKNATQIYQSSRTKE